MPNLLHSVLRHGTARFRYALPFNRSQVRRRTSRDGVLTLLLVMKFQIFGGLDNSFQEASKTGGGGELDEIKRMYAQVEGELADEVFRHADGDQSYPAHYNVPRQYPAYGV